MPLRGVLLLLVSLLLAPVVAAAENEVEQPGAAEQATPDEPVLEQRGEASYYSDKFRGRKTATGERFRQDQPTAASRDLPLGTRATVTNEANGKSVDVQVNDRGPYTDGRVIDLSKSAAQQLEMKKDGVAPVRVEARPSSQPTEELRDKVEEKAERQDESRHGRAAK